MTGGATLDEQTVLDGVPTGLFIGGEFREAGTTFAVDDPATGEVLAHVADGTAADAEAALSAAADAAAGWAATPPRERSEILSRAYETLKARADDLGLLITLEMGKPLAEAKGEVTYAAEFFRWFAEEAVRIRGSYGLAPGGDVRVLTTKAPVGPCLLVTPWNFPLAMGTRKVGAALAAGCTVVLKPAEQTPLASLVLATVLAEAGVPNGVVNVLPTSDPGAVVTPLMADRRLRKVSFTGSTEIGRLLMRQASDNLLRVSMELGGNAAFLVFDDADLDAAVDAAMVAKLRNIGESCVAANRFLVHESVAGDFASALAERFGALKVGRGTEEGVTVGPLIDPPAKQKVSGLVGEAIGAGARALVGGDGIDGPGHFYAPTVLDGVPAGARIGVEEIFGPVAAITTFRDEDTAISTANATEYGLVGYVFTQNLDRALRVAERLETGMVGVNKGLISNPAAPFGGVKHSGFGREGGAEGIEEYLSLRYFGLPV